MCSPRARQVHTGPGVDEANNTHRRGAHDGTLQKPRAAGTDNLSLVVGERFAVNNRRWPRGPPLQHLGVFVHTKIPRPDTPTDARTQPLPFATSGASRARKCKERSARNGRERMTTKTLRRTLRRELLTTENKEGINIKQAEGSC